jgi:hypothetical protein
VGKKKGKARGAPSSFANVAATTISEANIMNECERMNFNGHL